MNFIKLLSVFFLTFLFACNTIDNPLKDTEKNTCGDENGPTPIRKILLEDFTGHRCPNCPDAARIVETLIETYCDRIVPIGIHVGFFASPSEGFPDDYRTETGNQLDNYFNISNRGLPNGLVNRTAYEGDFVIGRTNWAAAVNLLYNTKPDVDISINSSYNPVTQKITATITAEYFSDIDYPMNLCLYVTEDSIISPQIDGSETIENYIHRHVLRKGVNGPFGENFVTSAKFGDIIEKSFTFNAGVEWNINHCELVVFISKKSTNEVIQAESEQVKTE